MPNKLDRPYAEYPLFSPASGQWAKKIKGRLHYFGVWDDSQAALEEYVKQRDFYMPG